MARSVVVPIVLAALLAGCTDFSGDGEAELSLQGIDVSAPEVGAGRLGLAIHLAIHNGGGRSDPVNVTVRAYDLATGLLVETSEVSLGRLAKERTHDADVPITVPRAAGYRLVVDVEEDDERVHRATVQASNLASLEPNIHDTGLRIAASDFRVLSNDDDRAQVLASVALTNEGTSVSRPLQLQVKAREDATGLVVADEWTSVASVGLDATKLANVTLGLPAGHNYRIEAILWDGDVIVERGEGRVQFAPTTTVPAGHDVVVSTPDLDDFVYDGGDGSSKSSKSPGPAIGLVLVGLVGLALLWRRRA